VVSGAEIRELRPLDGALLPSPAAPLHRETDQAFWLTKSAHMTRSDYQIRCSERANIIKFDTRYQIKRAGNLLKYMSADSWN
jgi:hypothetical protein